jgi:hypothetical protein
MPWDRDREVDSDHSHLDLMGELARHIAIPSEDRCAISEFVLVDHVGLRSWRALRRVPARRLPRSRSSYRF